MFEASFESGWAGDEVWARALVWQCGLWKNKTAIRHKDAWQRPRACQVVTVTAPGPHDLRKAITCLQETDTWGWAAWISRISRLEKAPSSPSDVSGLFWSGVSLVNLSKLCKEGWIWVFEVLSCHIYGRSSGCVLLVKPCRFWWSPHCCCCCSSSSSSFSSSSSVAAHPPSGPCVTQWVFWQKMPKIGINRNGHDMSHYLDNAKASLTHLILNCY